MAMQDDVLRTAAKATENAIRDAITFINDDEHVCVIHMSNAVAALEAALNAPRETASTMTVEEAEKQGIIPDQGFMEGALDGVPLPLPSRKTLSPQDAKFIVGCIWPLILKRHHPLLAPRVACVDINAIADEIGAVYRNTFEQDPDTFADCLDGLPGVIVAILQRHCTTTGDNQAHKEFDAMAQELESVRDDLAGKFVALTQVQSRIDSMLSRATIVSRSLVTTPPADQRGVACGLRIVVAEEATNAG